MSTICLPPRLAPGDLEQLRPTRDAVAILPPRTGAAHRCRSSRTKPDAGRLGRSRFVSACSAELRRDLVVQAERAPPTRATTVPRCCEGRLNWSILRR